MEGHLHIMGLTKLVVRGARQHNLKNISLENSRNSLTVITGLSGSGKSSWHSTRFTRKGNAIRSIPVGLRQAVPGSDGTAGS